MSEDLRLQCARLELSGQFPNGGLRPGLLDAVGH